MYTCLDPRLLPLTGTETKMTYFHIAEIYYSSPLGLLESSSRKHPWRREGEVGMRVIILLLLSVFT